MSEPPLSESLCTHDDVPIGTPVLDCCGICEQFPSVLCLDVGQLICGTPGAACFEIGSDPSYIDFDGQLPSAHYRLPEDHPTAPNVSVCRWQVVAPHRPRPYPVGNELLEPYHTCGHNLRYFYIRLQSIYNITAGYLGFELRFQCDGVEQRQDQVGYPYYPTSRWLGQKRFHDTPVGRYDPQEAFIWYGRNWPNAPLDVSECNLAP